MRDGELTFGGRVMRASPAGVRRLRVLAIAIRACELAQGRKLTCNKSTHIAYVHHQRVFPQFVQTKVFFTGGKRGFCAGIFAGKKGFCTSLSVDLRISAPLVSQPVTRHTIAASLRSCADSTDLEQGELIHDHLIRDGLAQDPFFGSLLVYMYGSCGVLEAANACFIAILHRDAYFWNFMMKACIKHGNTEDSLMHFKQMQLEGVLPNRFVFATVLSACACQTSSTEGARIHACIRSCDFDSDVIMGTALVNMYGKCGSVEETWAAFDKIRERDVVSWNALITGYCQHGECSATFVLLDRMQQEGIAPSKVTYVPIFDACANARVLYKGRLIHAQVVGAGFELNFFVVTALINMYGECRKFPEAFALFKSSEKEDVALWNAMISKCVKHDRHELALQLFCQMYQEQVLPDEATYASILLACTDPSTVAEGKRTHARIVSGVLESSVYINNALISMYGKSGKLRVAKALFNKMWKDNVVTWNAMIAGYCFNGQSEVGMQLYCQMQKKNVKPNKFTFITMLDACINQVFLSQGKKIHTWIGKSGLELDVSVQNALISMYGRCGSLKDVLELFKRMAKWDYITFVSVLTACANGGALKEARFVHKLILGNDFESDLLVTTALINVYGKCCNLEDAQWVFDRMPERDVYAWTSVISSYAQHGRSKPALQLFDQMQKEGLKPNQITIATIVSAYDHVYDET